MSRVLCSVVVVRGYSMEDYRMTRSARHLSTMIIADHLYRSTLQRCQKDNRTGRPDDVGLRELSSSDVHSTTVASRLVSSCLTFSPLPAHCIVTPRTKEML